MRLTLNALFDYTNDDGIFTYLNNYDVPWKNDVDADLLDLDYHSKYGTRIVSKTVTSLLTTEGLPTANKNKLAKLAYSKNKAKWDELWRTLGLYNDFNVLDNTDWEESVTIEHEGEDAKTQNLGSKTTQFSKGAQQNSQTKGEEIDTFAHGAQSKTLTKGEELDTTAHGAQAKTFIKGNQISTFEKGAQSNTIGSHTDQIGGQTVTIAEDKYAFNSSNASHDNSKNEQISSRSDVFGQHNDTEGAREDRTSEGQRQDSESLNAFSDTFTQGARSDSESSASFTDTNTQGQRLDSQTEGARSDSQTEGAQQNTESGTNAFSETTTTTRHGNIGVTTAGQLIRDFRKTVNWNFFETVFEDLNELLVIEVYGKEDDDLDDYTIITKYVLPIASAAVLGGIKVGENLTINPDGTLNAQIEGGGVSAVNGKTGNVTLNASDVGAATLADIKVKSVNNKTGNVTLNASDVGAATSQDIQNAIQGIIFPVTKVNNKTGNVTLNASDVGAATSQDIQNAIQGISFPVVSVNNKTGQITLDASDVGAATSQDIQDAISNVRQVPSGGTTNQILTKTADGYGWENSQGGGSSDELIVTSGHNITIAGNANTLIDCDTVLYKSGDDFITYNLANGFFTVSQTTKCSVEMDGNLDNSGVGWIVYRILKCTTPAIADSLGSFGSFYWNYTFGFTKYPIVKLEPGFYYAVVVNKANSGNYIMSKTAYNPTVNEYQVSNYIRFVKKDGVYLPT